MKLPFPPEAGAIVLKRVSCLMTVAFVSGCFAVHPIAAPEDAAAVSVGIGGYGQAEDRFRLEIDDADKVRQVARRLNALSGKRRADRSGALDANSADIVFYREGKAVYTLYAYHNTVSVGGRYYEVGEDLVSRAWWLQFK